MALVRCATLVAVVFALLAVRPAAQHYQTDFPPDEFRARWARVFDRIGADAVAVVQGAPMATGFNLPRQSNSFYYLSGIETPHAYLRLDGRTRTVTLYLPPRNERLERAEGRVLSAEDAEQVRALTGADAVRPTTAMGEPWPLDGNPARAIYAEFAPAEGYAESRSELQQAHAMIAADPWDARGTREVRFRELLQLRNPRAEIRNLSPILDELRTVKSPREVALIRRASQIAGLGMMEAMRSTEPGVFEYQLDAVARYVFIANGARLDAYR
ncbi:MAG: aminopeptidase P N-terminal domain-containing protein, partial [Acidobacteriota bacterium]